MGHTEEWGGGVISFSLGFDFVLFYVISLQILSLATQTSIPFYRELRDRLLHFCAAVMCFSSGVKKQSTEQK